MRFRQLTIVFAMSWAMMCGGTASGAELVLAENGQSAYRIVLSDNASPSTKHGAEELQMFLQEMTGAKLPIVSDQQPQGPKEILLGDNAHLKKLGVTIDLAPLGQEGYVIRTIGEHLVIAGGQVRGNMYGVYGFLEDHLGCRWFAPGVSQIPRSARLAIGSIDDRQVPVLEYREPFMFECFDGDWCARNRMNSGRSRLDARHGGKMEFYSLCHTFMELVPVEQYFDAHPEYYSLVKGKRLKQDSQLCCTNPEVIHICTESVRKAMRSQPEKVVFSVSVMAYDNHCECSNCQELAKQEDSQAGPVLYLVNRVAEGVEKEFPDKLVQTLVGGWSGIPPKNIRPQPNVVLMLCSSGNCCFSHSFETCDLPHNRGFCENLDGWAKVAPRLWIWDYCTDFERYLLPFPNQRVRGPNIRFLVAHNVKGIFAEDAYNTANSELAMLGGYMTAKFLWNPNYDADLAMREFLEGYYGKAAEPIRAYLDMLHDCVERKNIHVHIYGEVDPPYLTDELLTKANTLWQQAEKLVAGEPEVLHRVKLSRMSVDFAILGLARSQAQKKLPANKAIAKMAVARFQPFFEVLQGSSLTCLGENRPLDKKAYRRDLAKDLGIAIDK